jgi:type II secretory ATPase GspE/PulE/Tfp pilus assembly ATPase PilB-like protein
VLTVEDPVGTVCRHRPDQVNAKIDLTFAKALRAICARTPTSS